MGYGHEYVHERQLIPVVECPPCCHPELAAFGAPPPPPLRGGGHPKRRGRGDVVWPLTRRSTTPTKSRGDPPTAQVPGAVPCAIKCTDRLLKPASGLFLYAFLSGSVRFTEDPLHRRLHAALLRHLPVIRCSFFFDRFHSETEWLLKFRQRRLSREK